MLKRYLIIIILIGCVKGYSQNILILDKPGKVNRIRYYTGDLIHLKTHDREKLYGEIEIIKDSSFVVNRQEIKLSEVKYIQNTKRHKGWDFLSGVSLTAGLGYFILDSGNKLINGEGREIANSRMVVTTSIFMGVFLVSNRIANRKYRINKNRKLKIINLDIG